ncbi:MAG: hypothetical protein V7646_4876 [Pseudonocardia sp.]|jgi:hypothetical protein
MRVMITVPAQSEQRRVLARLLCTYARSVPPRTVTVVGNGPLSDSAERAATIDDSDLVVRMTTFALDTRHGPARRGRRADIVVLHRAVVPGPGTFADHSSRLYLLVEPGRLYWEREDRPDWWPVHPVSVPNAEFTVPLKALMGLAQEDASWPTTGTLVTYMMTELFPDAVTRLAGTTIVEQSEQTSFTHDWGPAVKVTGEHRLVVESALLRSWVEQGRIELLR